MKKYILKRLLSTIPILLIVSIVIFFIVHLTPGDPARVSEGFAHNISYRKRPDESG